MRTSVVIEALERLADSRRAEGWDNVGLLLGSAGDELSGAAGGGAGRVLLCIDLTEAVAAEAIERGCGLVVSYHPPIFKGIQRLTDGDWKGRALLALARAGVAVYSPHTALDVAAGGVNDWLCDGLGAEGEVPKRRAIVPAGADKRSGERAYKMVVFVPTGDGHAGVADAVRAAMSGAGAGWIGNYRECAFEVAGVGGFRALEGANPAVGAVGGRETVAEVRLEMVCTGDRLAAVVAAARAAHPYEEVALDVFEEAPIVAEALVGGGEGGGDEAAVGAGRVVELAEAVTPAALAERVKARLGLAEVRLGWDGPAEERAVRTVALCVGSGGDLFDSVEADAYVTGELSHHGVLDLVERGKAVVLAGHTHTERPYLGAYAERIAAEVAGAGGAVEVLVSEADRCPWVGV